MMEWFSELSSFEKFYWVITGVSSLFFVFILISTFVGGDVDDVGDVDAEIDADTGVGFQFFTLKNTVAFFAIFGWSGVSSINSGNSTSTTLIISMISGLIMMILVALLMFYMRKLNDSGTLRIKNALGGIGEVYTTIGANRSKIGKVQIKVQSSLRDLEALTDHDTDLTQGEVIKVVEVTSNGILIVEPQKK
ncbi:hypothetical protein [Pseudotenacibaculum haliotis]|uniref:NfeD-like C-terminal domain-containing protein n=1 Tax=Pseudotenacibaculum haliotis TaxID=1862138 RepID=A0ABW5LR61_9FLAO